MYEEVRVGTLDKESLIYSLVTRVDDGWVVGPDMSSYRFDSGTRVSVLYVIN